MDVRETPAWKRALGLAHEVCATLEDAGEQGGESAQRLRRAALAVPSLVADAFLDSDARDCRERLSDAAERVAEVRQLIRSAELLLIVPSPEAEALLAEVEALAVEIRALGGRCPEA